ncbi:MAG: Ig-like domain-containing protein [Clostridia bacterium]
MVKLRVFVAYVYTDSSPNNVLVSIHASDNTDWAEDLGKNKANFPANNYAFPNLQNINVASNTGVLDTTNVDTTSTGCTPIANTLLGCLNFDVTDYVTNKIAGGATDVTFLLSGMLGTKKTAYFMIYPNENATYTPQLIFTGVTGVANGASYNSDRTITLSDGTATLDGSAFASGSTVSAEGTHTLIVTDAAGKTTTVTFIIDKTAPVVSGVTEGSLYNVNKTITFNEGTATLDGSAFTSGSTVSAEGAHTLIVTDAAGNTTTVNFTIDKTPPTVSGVTNGASYNSDRTITLSDGTATLNGASFTSGSTVSAEGAHTLIVTDTVGNTTTVHFTIDKTVPVVSGVTEGGLYNVNKTITFNEGTATLDGSAFTSGSAVSAEGTHTLIVTDAAGNVTTVNFTIDKTPPTVTGVTDGASYNSDRTITLGDGTATLNGAAFASGSTVSAEGTYTLIATDEAGNTTTVHFTIVKSKAATLTSTIGTVSNGGTANESITNIPFGTTLAAFKAAITPAANATFEVYDADGTTVATTLASGKKVIVTAQDGITKVTYTVNVRRQSPPTPSYYPVTDVSLDQTELILTAGEETVVLHAAINPSYATIQSVTWSSSDPRVAIVDDKGVVTPIAAGTATITVMTTDQAKMATARVKVVEVDENKFVGLEVSEKSVLLKPNKSFSITVHAIYSNGTKENITKDKEVTYRTSSKTFATVTKGVIKAGKKEGQATITITYQGKKVKVPVWISKLDVTKLEIQPTNLQVEVDQVEQLSLTATLSNKKAKDVTKQAIWETSEPTVATIDESGKLTAMASGTTVITAAYGGKTTEITVEVNDAKQIKRLAASKPKVTVGVGKEQSIKLTATYQDHSKKIITNQAKWSSEDETIATVNNGVIIGQAKGTVKIQAKYKGKTVTITVTVTN